MSVKQKKRGRPGRDSDGLNCEAIVSGAKQWLLQENKKLSIRALANHLEVDPMAIYHYFANKAALLEAITVSIMQDLYEPGTGDNWKMEITQLCGSYLTLLRDHPGLLETLLSMGEAAEVPADVFSERFYLAITPLELRDEQKKAALDLLVDYLHGFALALQCTAKKSNLELSAIEESLALYLRALQREALES